MWHVCSNWGMRLQVGPSFRRNVFGPLCNFSLQGVMNEILDSTGLTWRSNCDGENSQNRTEEAGGGAQVRAPGRPGLSQIANTVRKQTHSETDSGWTAQGRRAETRACAHTHGPTTDRTRGSANLTRGRLSSSPLNSLSGEPLPRDSNPGGAKAVLGSSHCTLRSSSAPFQKGESWRANHGAGWWEFRRVESKGGSGAPVKAGTREKGGLGLGKGAEVAPLGMGGSGVGPGSPKNLYLGSGSGKGAEGQGRTTRGAGRMLQGTIYLTPHCGEDTKGRWG